MSIELDRIVHRREPATAELAARSGAERVRPRAPGPIEPGRDGDRPTDRFPADAFELELSAQGDADVRVTLSAAALRLDPNPAGNAPSPGAPGPAPLDDSADTSGALDASLAPAQESTAAPAPRERVFDAYREPTPARRGERIRVVV